MIDALTAFVDQAHDGFQLGALGVSSTLIAAGVYIALRRCYFGLRACLLGDLTRRASNRGVL